MITANKSHTSLKTGARVSLKTLFFAAAAKPRGGWKVKFLLPGQTTPVVFDGKTAISVFSSVRQSLDANQINMSDESVWLNLNMAWLDRIDRKFWLLSREDLVSLIDQGEEERGVIGRVLTPPSVWGASAWKAMGLLLADEHYDWPFFLSFVKRILSLMDPASNPLTGCRECYPEFAVEVGRIEVKNYSRDEAREWLYSFHNRVNKRIGKPEKPRAAAWRENLWQ